jgi:AMP-activated protein kinase-like protein
MCRLISLVTTTSNLLRCSNDDDRCIVHLEVRASLGGCYVRWSGRQVPSCSGAFRMSSYVYPVTFRYPESAPAPVALVGSFNHWDPGAHPLECADGEWRITIYLPPGTYLYAFAIGGGIVRDPDPSRVLRGPLSAEYSVVTVAADPPLLVASIT